MSAQHLLELLIPFNELFEMEMLICLLSEHMSVLYLKKGAG